ncbi:unnamed protein product [Ilex paraguariensis]|uniref:Uncharacterized protein n=1 Tax=Ilex paraguariensis TaxID=185542 RepID=A0ABC8QT50_9AQUA
MAINNSHELRENPSLYGGSAVAWRWTSVKIDDSYLGLGFGEKVVVYDGTCLENWTGETLPNTLTQLVVMELALTVAITVQMLHPWPLSPNSPSSLNKGEKAFSTHPSCLILLTFS